MVTNPSAIVPESSVVSILHAPPTGVQNAVREAMEKAHWRQFITKGADVALKINLGWDIFLPGAVSAPWVVEGVVQTLRDYVGRIFLVESNQVVVNADKALHQTRLDLLCRRYGVEWVNMSRGRFLSIVDESRLRLKYIDIPEILTRTELITLPVMKTHNKTTITGAIKNQWGCLQTLRHNFHPILSEALVDINTIVRPRFAVMDATIGLEGNGPKSGQPKEVGLVLASGDIVALDTIAATLMGFDPAAIDHIQLCGHHRLGICDRSRITIVGEQVEACATPFVPARHNTVSFLELVLRQSMVRRLVFDTPLFALFCWGARRYYDLWDVRVGRHLRAAVLASSPYAGQWVS